MCPKPLEVTRTSLTTCCTSLCNNNSRNTYSLNKGLLIKYWWCLTSTLWTPSTSSPSTSHLHMSNGELKFNAVSLRHKHSTETLFIYRKYFIHNVYAFIGNARQLFNIKLFLTTKFSFRKFHFLKDFISFDFIFFYFFIFFLHFLLLENLPKKYYYFFSISSIPNKFIKIYFIHFFQFYTL